ncbi:leucine-rich repeat-containing protein 74A-like [Liolophura sinensis]|uniref:leucine-rich repeat-containing protein 74A-like n=1 Tax=Liolophura sinensis TaxID=3198878 RepID=UPI003157F5DC
MSVGKAKLKRSSKETQLSGLPEDGKCSIEDDQETVLDLDREYVPYDETGARAYENACKKLGVVPSSQYMRALAMSDTVKLCHYGLGSRGAMAICIPLVINMKITTLDLSHNHLGRKGVEYVRKMMIENDTITTLDISFNNLGKDGAREIAYMLKYNSSLRHLNLAGNDFTDDEAPLLLHAIEENVQLRSVNLSYNNFFEMSGESFKSLLTENHMLEELNLSWNKIRLKGALQIADGVKESRGLVKLDLSWNGFEDEGAMAMAAALAENKSLEELNVACNRITPEGFMKLCRAFQNNDTLTCIRVGRNFIAEEAVVLAISFLTDVKDLALQTLDLTGLVLGCAFKEQLQILKEVHENFTCVYGYETYGHQRNSNDFIADIINRITTYLDLTNRSIADLFTEVDTDGSMTVSLEEFRSGLKNALIPITPYQLDELIKYLDKDNDGEVDFGELVFMK